MERSLGPGQGQLQARRHHLLLDRPEPEPTVSLPRATFLRPHKESAGCSWALQALNVRLLGKMAGRLGWGSVPPRRVPLTHTLSLRQCHQHRADDPQKVGNGWSSWKMDVEATRESGKRGRGKTGSVDGQSGLPDRKMRSKWINTEASAWRRRLRFSDFCLPRVPSWARNTSPCDRLKLFIFFSTSDKDQEINTQSTHKASSIQNHPLAVSGRDACGAEPSGASGSLAQRQRSQARVQGPGGARPAGRQLTGKAVSQPHTSCETSPVTACV